MRVALGVDGGGTKTRALAVDEHGTVLGEGLAGPANLFDVGVAGAVESVRAACSQALAAAGTAAPASAAYFGLAGCGGPNEARRMAEAIQGLQLAKRVAVRGDYCAAHAGAFGGGPGIVVIAGTGSIAYGTDGRGAEHRAGGWGPLVSDEGSGFDIGRRGLAAALASFDGRGPKSRLEPLLLEALACDDWVDATRRIRDPRFGRSNVAALAPRVIDAAGSDRVAAGIVEAAGAALANLVWSVAHRLNLQQASPEVTGLGGLFAADRVMQAFSTQLRRRLPAARWITPRHDPAYGAALLALRLTAGREDDRSP